LAAALMEDFSALPPRERNMARRAFLGPQPVYGVSDVDAFGRSVAQQLRAASARYPDDPSLAALVSDLRAGSPRFARVGAAHEVHAEPSLRKTFQHPMVGPVTVNCDVLDITDRDQRVVIYTADPGSPSDEALRLLSVVGTQSFSAAP